MGVSYTYTSMVGFEVPLDRFYNTEKYTQWSCDHFRLSGDWPPRAKHCPECGRECKRTERTRNKLKTKMYMRFKQSMEFPGELEEDFLADGGGYLLHGEIKGCAVGLWHFSDMMGNEVFIAGIMLAHSREYDDDFHVSRPLVSAFPAPEKVAAFFESKGIVVMPGTWGSHFIVEAN